MKHSVWLSLDSLPGEDPFVYADVGAMGGVDMEWMAVQRRLEVVGFEPDDREFEKLDFSHGHRYLGSVLSSGQERLVFYVTRGAGNSSFLKPKMDFLRDFPRPERFQVVDEIVYSAERVSTLDTVLEHLPFDSFDFVKLDTQGSELAILHGGPRCLASAIGLKIEVSFSELYDGQPLFSDVDTHVRGAGFQLLDLRRFYWKRSPFIPKLGRGQLINGDALYIKEPKGFLQDLDECEATKNRILKYITVCLVYGFSDLAVWLLLRVQDAGHFPKDLGEELIRTIKADDRQFGALLREVRLRLGGVRRMLRRRLWIGRNDWADSDPLW